MTKKENLDTAGESRQCFGRSRIARALAKAEMTYSLQYPVPHSQHSLFYQTYDPSKLPPLKRFRDIHKITRLSRNQNLSFALRLATVTLLKNFEKVAMCTIRFNKLFASSLSRRDNPVNYYGRLIRIRLATVNIRDFYLVLEAGNSSNPLDLESLHAHIVFATTDGNLNNAKHALRKASELSLDKNGKVAPSSFVITEDYAPIVLYTDEKKAEFFEFDTEFDPDEWIRLETSLNGVKLVKFKRVRKQKLDIGIADYLAKLLHVRFFGLHRNYYITQSLTRNMKSFFNNHRCKEES